MPGPRRCRQERREGERTVQDQHGIQNQLGAENQHQEPEGEHLESDAGHIPNTAGLPSGNEGCGTHAIRSGRHKGDVQGWIDRQRRPWRVQRSRRDPQGGRGAHFGELASGHADIVPSWLIDDCTGACASRVATDRVTRTVVQKHHPGR